MHFYEFIYGETMPFIYLKNFFVTLEDYFNKLKKKIIGGLKMVGKIKQNVYYKYCWDKKKHLHNLMS